MVDLRLEIREMNYSRLGLAALGGTVASFAFGFLVLWLVPALFAMLHKGGSRTVEGARLGVLIGVLAVCNVLHNYANMNIGLNLALGQAAAYFVQWTIVGIVVGLIYKPPATSR